jgi:hypothetical protein
MEAVFTAGGRMTRPNGASLTGPQAIAASLGESFARFRATHHVSSDHVIDLDRDSARIRANLTAMHLWADAERDPNTLQTHFLAGGYSTPSQYAPARDGASAKCRCAIPGEPGAGTARCSRPGDNGGSQSAMASDPPERT